MRLMRWPLTTIGVTWLSVALNTMLGAVKIVCGYFFHSRALMADGVHSLVDLSTDLAVLLGLRMAALPRDRTHPYGHHKFASLAQVLIALCIFVFAALLIFQALLSLGSATPAAAGPGGGAFIAALAGLLVKEALFYQTRAVARRERSRLVMANAWHHRTDSLSSLIAATAIGTAWLGGPGWWFLDSMMAAGLGGFLAFEGLRQLLAGLQDLVDRAPGEEVLNDLREHILPTPGVAAYHDFRARRVGDMIEVDLHLQVAPDLTVAEGHAVAHAVRDGIMTRHPEVLAVLIHVEPDDPQHLRGKGLAGRN
jgi:cation diffusion facilitator family transporter